MHHKQWFGLHSQNNENNMIVENAELRPSFLVINVTCTILCNWFCDKH